MRRLESGPKRVVVAMSGGVDSSTVAGLLHEQGHDVVGVMMKLYDDSNAEADRVGGGKSCCGLDDVGDARRVADLLGIPFFVGAYADVFRERVVTPFVEEYLQGRTPNPCVRCNDDVKFTALLDQAKRLGADYLATGHYARTRVDASGHVSLWTGRDGAKDQSYFLAGVDEEALQRVVFPLGGLTKQEVRAHAQRLDLPVAAKKESQDICFVADDDHGGFVERFAGDRAPKGGEIVSLDGLRLGRHRGVHRYTVGQRRGLGLSSPEPYFVVSLDAESERVVVGRRADAHSAGVRAGETSWLAPPPEVGDRVGVRIRYRHGSSGALVVARDHLEISLRFDEPQLAVTPGQQLAFYDGERVLGAATILAALDVSADAALESAHG
jgi:tRNA-specific 2-thiouridylase